MRARKQHSHITHKVFEIDAMLDNYESLCLAHKRERLLWFRECFPAFLDADLVHCGLEYCAYLLDNQRRPESERARREVRRIMESDTRLALDIVKRGLKKPLDCFVMNGRYQLARGYRRLFILKKAGYRRVPCRVFKSRDYFHKLKPPTESTGRLEMLGEEQFKQHLDKATDKYWIHSYLPLYERHIGEPKKILEVGILNGASTLIWHQAFPEAQLFGLDRNVPQWIEPVPCTMFIGDQGDPDEAIKAGPYDLIIDDASHRPGLTLKTFDQLWPSVVSGGWYVIEDLYWNYRDNMRNHAMVDRLQGLVDDMNIEAGIMGLHFYNNIAFVQKR